MPARTKKPSAKPPAKPAAQRRLTGPTLLRRSTETVANDEPSTTVAAYRSVHQDLTLIARLEGVSVKLLVDTLLRQAIASYAGGKFKHLLVTQGGSPDSGSFSTD